MTCPIFAFGTTGVTAEFELVQAASAVVAAATIVAAIARARERFKDTSAGIVLEGRVRSTLRGFLLGGDEAHAR